MINSGAGWEKNSSAKTENKPVQVADASQAIKGPNGQDPAANVAKAETSGKTEEGAGNTQDTSGDNQQNFWGSVVEGAVKESPAFAASQALKNIPGPEKNVSGKEKSLGWHIGDTLAEAGHALKDLGQAAVDGYKFVKDVGYNFNLTGAAADTASFALDYAPGGKKLKENAKKIAQSHYTAFTGSKQDIAELIPSVSRGAQNVADAGQKAAETAKKVYNDPSVLIDRHKELWNEGRYGALVGRSVVDAASLIAATPKGAQVVNQAAKATGQALNHVAQKGKQVVAEAAEKLKQYEVRAEGLGANGGNIRIGKKAPNGQDNMGGKTQADKTAETVAKNADDLVETFKKINYNRPREEVLADLNAATPKKFGGEWRLSGENSPTQAGAAFQQQVTGVPHGYAYYVNDVKFDGIRGNALVDSKDYSAAQKKFINKDKKQFHDWFGKGKGGVLETARKQVRVANGTPIEWVVTDPTVGNAYAKLLREKGIEGLKVVAP